MPKPPTARTVLIVEDDADTRDAVAEHFRDRGFRTLVAADGSEALRLIESDHYIDLLVSDFVLPGANGRSLVKIAEFFRPEIKIIIMSGQPVDAIPPELRSQLLGKPVDAAELDALTRALFS